MGIMMVGQKEVQEYMHQRKIQNDHRAFDEGARKLREKRKLLNRKIGISTIAKYVMIEVIVKNIQTYGKLTCEYCKKSLDSRSIHFDHIVPKNKGGKGTVNNTNISCASCNQLKKDKPLDIFLEQLKEIQESLGGSHV